MHRAALQIDFFAALRGVNSNDRGHRRPLMRGYGCSALLLPWHPRTTPKPGPLRPWLQTPETTATCVSWRSPLWRCSPTASNPMPVHESS